MIIIPSASEAASTINCQFYNVGPIYTCLANKVALNGSPTGITGSNIPGYNNSRVLEFRVAFPNNFTLIPSRIFEVFTNLELLNLFNVRLASLAGFQNCSKLQEVIIRSNPLTAITDSFAETCTSIKLIVMTANQIATIGSDAFKGLANLEYLDLRNNQINALNNRTFQYSPKLISINLYNNKIAELEPTTFATLKVLTYLYLRLNVITRLEAKLFRNNTALKLIDLSSNKIEMVAPTIFDTWTSTNTTVDLLSNICINKTYSPLINSSAIATDFGMCFENYPVEIIEICATTSECRFYLDEFRVYTCVIERTDSCLIAINGTHQPGYADQNVTAVYVRNSYLKTIPNFLLQHFVNLEKLSVKATGVMSLPSTSFQSCRKLKQLDLSYNDIAVIDDATFANCSNLEYVDLTGNNFGTLKRSQFVNNNRLQVIVLHKQY